MCSEVRAQLHSLVDFTFENSSLSPKIIFLGFLLVLPLDLEFIFVCGVR